VKQKEQGDEEAQGIDETFIDAYDPESSFLSHQPTDTSALEWNTDSRRRVDGASGLTASSCSSRILQVRILYFTHRVMALMLCVIDIKEVLLFPAMKPELATAASGPAGQVQN
jgi:hypothetical protein